MGMSCAPTLSPHHSHYTSGSTCTSILSLSLIRSLYYTFLSSLHLCGIIFHCMQSPHSAFPRIPDSDTVHASSVYYLRYSPPPLYFDTGQYTTVSTSFLALSCALASLGSVGSCHSVWIGRVGRFSQFYPLSSSPSRFGLSPSSPGFLPDQLPHSHIEIPPSLQRLGAILAMYVPLVGPHGIQEQTPV